MIEWVIRSTRFVAVSLASALVLANLAYAFHHYDLAQHLDRGACVGCVHLGSGSNPPSEITLSLAGLSAEAEPAPAALSTFSPSRYFARHQVRAPPLSSGRS